MLMNLLILPQEDVHLVFIYVDVKVLRHARILTDILSVLPTLSNRSSCFRNVLDFQVEAYVVKCAGNCFGGREAIWQGLFPAELSPCRIRANSCRDQDGADCSCSFCILGSFLRRRSARSVPVIKGIKRNSTP